MDSSFQFLHTITRYLILSTLLVPELSLHRGVKSQHTPAPEVLLPTSKDCCPKEKLSDFSLKIQGKNLLFSVQIVSRLYLVLPVSET